LNNQLRLWLDLGRLWAIGQVWLNDRPLGCAWKPPYRFDITAHARRGHNHLVVAVANTWSNRLIGDAHLPPEQRYGRTNITASGTPAKMWRDIPLHESGLLGPVRLVPAATRAIPLPR
jgi:hypothetical protein